MSFNFPNAPITGQLYPATVTAGLPQYRYDGEKWRTLVAVAGTASVFCTDNPPVAPTDGMLWWESDTGNLYVRYNDGDSTQWVICGQFPSLSGVVRYDATQGLTTTQKAQARANIDALKKNYITNGGMQISQENGATAGTVNGYFPVDQFLASFSNAGALSVAQVASITPGGSPNRLRVTVTAADASVGAGDLVTIGQPIEGLRCADLKSGSASAKTVTIQFGCKGPAGTYCVSIRNNATTRSYVAEFTIAGGEANTDVVKSVTIPLDQTGTWTTDNTAGLYVYFALMCGSTFQAAAGAWAAGNLLASSNQFNFMGTNGNVFELFDVGLYEGTVAPAFQLPDYATEYIACARYWYYLPGGSTVCAGTVRTGGTAAYLTNFPTPVPMRTNPIITLGAGAAIIVGDTITTLTALTMSVNGSSLQPGASWSGSVGTIGQSAVLYAGSTNTKLNARM